MYPLPKLTMYFKCLAQSIISCVDMLPRRGGLRNQSTSLEQTCLCFLVSILRQADETRGNSSHARATTRYRLVKATLLYSMTPSHLPIPSWAARDFRSRVVRGSQVAQAKTIISSESC